MFETCVDFYSRHAISPVWQDISDINRHFDRRAALYRHLGILPSSLTGRRVLEVGPGSGYNSLYTAFLRPASYDLVDANETGILNIKNLFSEFPELLSSMRTFHSHLESFESEARYDFVFCEGMLPGTIDPKQTIRLLGNHVVPSGVLVVTTIDAVSYLAETLRRTMANLVLDDAMTLDAKVHLLLPAFSTHLATLKSMSRKIDDWIIDVIINPSSHTQQFSIAQAIESLSEVFEAFRMSPLFLTDFRWYKDIHGESKCYNAMAIQAYKQNVHSFLDYRFVFAPMQESANEALVASATKIQNASIAHETDRRAEHITDIIDQLSQILKTYGPLNSNLSKAMTAAISLLKDSSLTPEKIGNSQEFSGWFGRGQQYISFEKKSA